MTPSQRLGKNKNIRTFFSQNSVQTAFAFITVLLFGVLSAGFISTRSAGGAAVSWGRGAHLIFRSNPTSTSDISQDQIFNVLTTSLNRWKQAALGGFDFTYYQGKNTALYPNYSNSTADNSIYFTSNANNSGDRLPCGLIAVTQVWFNNTTGQATKADLRFNDNCYNFTNNAVDTASQSRIYLADVATHELGHALGLDHSQSLQSSMIYTAAVQESQPSCDDISAMTALYGDVSRTGTLTGSVQAPNGGGIFGAFVEAISLERGVSLSSTLSETDGSYTIRGLEAGSYRVVVSPFYPGAGSLSRYYGAINTRVCGGSHFLRTFGDNVARVESGSVASMAPITASCVAMSGKFSGQERNPSTAPVLSNAGLAAPASAVNVFNGGSTHHYYALQQVQGNIEVHALAYSLFSRADVSIELLDSAGRRVSSQQAFGDVFSARSGYVNYDAMASAVITEPSNLIVHVFQRSTVPTSAFPSGSMSVDAVPFYVVTASQGVPQGMSNYSVNARCEQTDTFSTYPRLGDPGALPNRNNGEPSTPAAGCGTINNDSGGPTNHNPFEDAGAQMRFINFGALVMFLMMAQQALRRQKKVRIVN